MKQPIIAAKIGVSALIIAAVTLSLPPAVMVGAFVVGNLVFLVCPYSIISFCFVPLQPPNNPIPIAIDYAQCVIYGIILAQGWVRGVFRKTLLWLCVAHVVAVVVTVIVWPHTGLVWPL